jgi:hypothetical protein
VTGNGSRDRDDVPVRVVLEQEHRDVLVRPEARPDSELHALLAWEGGADGDPLGASPGLPVGPAAIFCSSSPTLSEGSPSPSSASW